LNWIPNEIERATDVDCALPMAAGTDGVSGASRLLAVGAIK
jgi:hypothetical protein